MNGSNLAPLYAFAITLVVAANVPYGMFAWTPFWAVYAYRRTHMSPRKGTGS